MPRIPSCAIKAVGATGRAAVAQNVTVCRESAAFAPRRRPSRPLLQREPTGVGARQKCVMPMPAPRSGCRIAGSLILAVLMLAACSDQDAKARAAALQASQAVPVIAADAARKTVPIELAAIGTVQPSSSVAVKARIDGQLDAVHFKEGDTVRKGQPLFTIDPRPLQAQLSQAEANLSKDRAILANAQAQDRRYADLLARNFISREYYNQIRTNVDTAQASVAADQAAVRSAQVQLAYASIASPIDGVAGKLLIQQGNMIKANDANPLVVINQVSPIYADFAVPEQNLQAIREAMGRGPVRVAAAPEQGAGSPGEGVLSFVDNSVDIATGTIRLRATFPNEDRALWPGEYVRVTLILGEQRDAVVVPAQAVQAGPEGAFVFVVQPDLKAQLRPVTAGRSAAGETVIAKGLNAGEKVVVDGQSRLAPGATVKLQQTLAEGGK